MTLTAEDKRWLRKEVARQIKKASVRSDALMTQEQAARFLAVSTRTLRRLAKEYHFRTELDNSEKLIRYRPMDLHNFVRHQNQETRRREQYVRKTKAQRKPS